MEGVISQIKLFNAGSGWRTLTCVRWDLSIHSGPFVWHGGNAPSRLEAKGEVIPQPTLRIRSMVLGGTEV